MRRPDRLIRTFAACAFACISGIVAATAQSPAPWARCTGRDIDRAIEACSQIITATDEALKLNPGSESERRNRASALVARARAYLARADWSRAAADLDQVLQSDSTSRGAVEAFSLRATARYQMSDFAGAIADSEAALKLDPNNERALRIRSIAHVARGTASSNVGPASLPDALLAYVAHGPAGACGEQCEEWLAVEGIVDWQAPERLIAALDRLGARRIPVVIDFRDARNVPSGMTMGKILRERGFDVTVGETRAEGCHDPVQAECMALKRSGKLVTAKLVPRKTCDTTCVLALAGGVRRTVPEATTIVIGGMVAANRIGLKAEPVFQEGRRARVRDLIKIYLTQMGVDPQVADMIDQQYDSGRRSELSRQDVVRLRIVTTQ